MARLLVVEDDEAIARPLLRALLREGFDVEHLDRGSPAVERALSGDVDLVLLDLTLPDGDGLEVCRAVRSARPHLPIVMLTARGEELDVVVGFDAGADDYVSKPFSLAELLARIRARLRVAGPPAGRILEQRGVRMDVSAHRAWFHGKELDLTPKEFDLLALLVSDAGRVIPRSQIMRDVWDEQWVGSTRTLDTHVAALRRKLEDDSGVPQLISTVRGVGFRFETA